jgi:hypothetical protein
MSCAASVRLSKGLPESPSEHAAEGTAAHELAERCLTNKRHTARDYLGDTIPVGRDFSFEVDEEMADAVDVYLREIDRIREEGPDLEEWVERRFSLEALRPPQPMFGTSDYTAYSRANRTLYVRDYKHGRGKRVDVEGNPQIFYYALGALLSLPRDYPVKWVDVGIVQPRVGNVANQVVEAEALLDFAGELMEAARATEDPNAIPVPGEWCRWCKAKAICPALQSQALETARVEFGSPATPPSPASLTPAQVAEVLAKADVIEDWIAAVRKHALLEAEQGRAPPGFKLVAKRAVRKWAADDEYTVPELVLATNGTLTYDDFYERKLVSPAQAEKLLKTAKAKLPEGLVNSVSSGYTLATEDDKRPAVNLLSAGDEFDVAPQP